jgi:hypothetical protein
MRRPPHMTRFSTASVSIRVYGGTSGSPFPALYRHRVSDGNPPVGDGCAKATTMPRGAMSCLDTEL